MTGAFEGTGRMEKRYKKGEIIIKQGDIKDKYMYYLIKGKAIINRTIKDSVIDCGNIHQGDIFGEMSLIVGTERTATVMAAEDDVVVLQLDKRLFFEEVQRNPEFAWQILSKLAIRTQMLNEIQDQITNPSFVKEMISKSVWL
jgi:CRP-like cAMP-binding protein